MPDHMQKLKSMNTKFDRSIRNLVSYFFIVFVLVNCTLPPVTIKPELKHSPLIGKLPISIGVYYPPSFREYEYTSTDEMFKYKSRFLIGTACVNFFNKVLPVMFSRVEIFDTKPPYFPQRQNIAAVLEPEIHTFQIDSMSDYGGFSSSMGFYSSAIFLIKLYDIDGTMIDSWSISGDGYERYLYFKNPMNQRGRSAESAIIDTIAQFMVSVQHRSEIKRWLQKHGFNKDSIGR